MTTSPELLWGTSQRHRTTQIQRMEKYTSPLEEIVLQSVTGHNYLQSLNVIYLPHPFKT